MPGILRNLAGWRLDGAAHDVHANLLVGLLQLDLLQGPGRNEKGRAATGDDTFLDCGTGRVESVLHQFLALLDLDFRGAADLDDGNTAGELRQTLLQLLAIVLGAGLLGLLADLVAAALDVRLPAGSADDHRVLLGELDALGRAQHVEGDVLELDADVLADHLATGQDGNVLEHRLASVAEARCLAGGHLETSAQSVDDERGKSLAFDILGDDHQRAPRLNDLFENRQHVLHVRDLLLVEHDEGILELRDHLLGVGDEIGRNVAAIELHALDCLELGADALVLLDSDDAFLADRLHGVGDHLADGVVAVGRNGADLLDFIVGVDLARTPGEIPDHRVHRGIDTAPQIHRVHPGSDRLRALAHDRLGEQGGRGRAVAGNVIGLGGHLAHHLGAHVLELVLELDLLGDGHTILGDARRPEGLVENHHAALGPKRHLDRIGQNVDTPDHARSGISAELNVFRSHVLFVSWSVQLGAGAMRLSP